MVEAEWSRDFIEISFNVDEAKDAAGNKIEFAQYLDNLYTELCNRLENTYYDTFRASVIGQVGSIASDDYAAELFSIFRNNTSDKERITVDSRYVMSSFTRFEGYEKAKNEAKRTQTNLEKEYKALKNSINGLVSKVDKKATVSGMHNSVKYAMDGDTLEFTDSKVIEKIDKFIKLKVDQVNQMSTIHLLAFTAKLDAMKDCFNQDKTVLYKALSKIQGMKKGDN